MNYINIVRVISGLCLSLLITTTSHACNKSITFMAGPFLTPSTTNHYWSDFATEITNKTGCKVTIKSSSNFEEYLSDITYGKADILVAPEHYRKALENNGFTVILRTKKDLNGYLVSRFDIKNHPQLLKNQIIYTQGYFREYT